MPGLRPMVVNELNINSNVRILKGIGLGNNSSVSFFVFFFILHFLENIFVKDISLEKMTLNGVAHNHTGSYNTFNDTTILIGYATKMPKLIEFIGLKIRLN